MQSIWDVITSVLLGLLLAGPLAAIAIVAAPEQWRGPLIPSAIAVAAVGFVLFLRHRKRPPV